MPCTGHGRPDANSQPAVSTADEFLADKTPAGTCRVDWGHQQLSFTVGSYLSQALPPADLITSVRGIVLREGELVVMENLDGRHFMPGGRIDPGETVLECLHREVREESGLTILTEERLGFLHFRHLQPEPDNYPYPYPDMFHLVFGVTAEGELLQGDEDNWEYASHLLQPSEGLQLPNVGPGQPFLEHIIETTTP